MFRKRLLLWFVATPHVHRGSKHHGRNESSEWTSPTRIDSHAYERTTCSLEKDVFVFIGRVVEDDDAAILCQLTDSAVTLEEFFRIEHFRPDTREVGGRTVQVNEREMPFAGDNGIVPVEEKDLVV